MKGDVLGPFGRLICVFLLLAVGSFSHSACPAAPVDEPSVEPALPDATTDKPIVTDQPPPERPTPDTPSKPLDDALKAKETRAGQITKESEKITGPQALSQVGDWKLYNDKVAFVIHGVGLSRSFSGATGHLIDAAPLTADGKATTDRLEEVFSGFGVIRVVRATKIEVLEPGGVDARAVIRVTGEDTGIPPVDALLRSAPFDGKIEVDYILKPSATHVEIILRLLGGDRLADQQMGDGLLLGDSTRLVADVVGFGVDKAERKPLKWFGAVGEGVSYLISPSDPSSSLQIPITQAAVFPAFGGLAASDETKSEYARMFFVGKGSLEEVLSAWHTQSSTTGLKTISGKVTGLDDLTKADIILNDKATNAAVSHMHPDDTGAFSFRVPDGQYELLVNAPGRKSLKLDAAFSANNAPTFAAGAALKLTIKEKALDGSVGGFVPVRVELRGPSFIRVSQTKDGQVIPVPPGEYDVTVSRGLAYEVWKKKLNFQPTDGKSVTLEETVTLEKVIDTSGYVGADMHLHATPSIDSELSLEERISDVVAEGLQFAVATDHDRFTDYSPVVEKLQVGRWVRTAIGQEVSPSVYHFNIYPLAQLPTNEPRYFGPEWAIYEDRRYKTSLDGPAIWSAVRKAYQIPIVQINHPRSNQAFLNRVNYDRTKGLSAVDKKLFDDNWDVIEIYNGGGRDRFLNENMLDWFSLLNQNQQKTGVGNSDSHSAGSRPGMPRTLIASPTQKGEDIKVNDVTQALKESRAIIWAGPFLRVQTDKKEGPGARVTGTKMTLDIEVTAPSWIPVAYVKVYANGALLKKYDVPASTDRVRFKQSLEVTPTKDTWYVVLAGDDEKAMTEVYQGRKPVSMTNPIYLDLDGKGFQAPGLNP